jgi:hypothetical protein
MSGPITIRICPATSNLPTRLTKSSWEALCRATQNLEAGAAASARGWNENLAGPVAVGSNYCAVCQGRILPPGLELIDAAELAALKTQVEEGMGKMTTGTCENCKRTGVKVQSIKGDKVCGSCAALYGAISNRPEAVGRALGKLAADMLDPAVPVAIDREALARIAEIVGYTGEDRAGLIEAVRVSVAPRHCEHSEAIPTRPADPGLLDLARALGLEASIVTELSAITLAAMQTAAMLEEAERTLARVTSTAAGWLTDLDDAGRDLGHIKEALGLPEDAEVSEITGAISELVHALARFRNLAEAAEAREDKFESSLALAAGSADRLLAENSSLVETVSEIREALQAQPSDESTVKVAARRMVVLAKLDKMYGESEEKISAIERHCEALKNENARLNDLLAAQNETVADYIDPDREIMLDFARRVLRGEACLTFAGR